MLMLYLCLRWLGVLSTYHPSSIVTPLFPASSRSHPQGLMRQSRCSNFEKNLLCYIVLCGRTLLKISGCYPKNQLRRTVRNPMINICGLNMKKALRLSFSSRDAEIYDQGLHPGPVAYCDHTLTKSSWVILNITVEPTLNIIAWGMSWTHFFITMISCRTKRKTMLSDSRCTAPPGPFGRLPVLSREC